MKKDLDPLKEADYEAIEAAVMETERGRWFLAKYTQRNRNSDTTVLLDAIGKLERSMLENRPAPVSADVDQVRFDLVEMAAAIAQTKREIASLKPDGSDDDDSINAATEELDAIVTATETATQEILEAAESVQELTWTMREAGVEEEHCEQIDNLITAIYTACSFQDITGQRTSKVVAVLRYLEERLEAMRHIWGGDDAEPVAPKLSDARPDAHLLNGPQLEGKGHDQEDVDLMIGSREELFDAVVTSSDQGAPAEAIVSELVTDDTVIEFDEESVPEEAILEFEEAPVEDETVDLETDTGDASSQGQMIMVRKPDTDETPDSDGPVEDTPAATRADVLPAGTDEVLLDDLETADKLALFS